MDLIDKKDRRTRLSARRKKRGARKKGGGIITTVDAKVTQKMVEALALRAQGYSYPQIAEHMKCSQSTAHKWVTNALAYIPQADIETVRRMESQRLDAMQVPFFDAALKGDAIAAATVLKIMDHRAKLNGLYMAERKNPANPEPDERNMKLIDADMTPQESAEAYAATLTAIAGQAKTLN